MEGIRKYAEIYKNGIHLGFANLYNDLKKEDISNNDRLKKIKGLVDNNLYHIGKVGGVVRKKWINKQGYILSKQIEYIIWNKINEDNHKIFGIGWDNFIDTSELKELIVLINKRTKNKKWDAKLRRIEKDGGLLVDVEDNFKYKKVSVRKNRVKVKEVIVEDYFGSDFEKKMFNVDVDGKKIKRLKVNKDKVLIFYRDRRKLLSNMNESYLKISRWLNKKYEYKLELDNNSSSFLDRVCCTVYYEVNDGKLLVYSSRLQDMINRGYISSGLCNVVAMFKRNVMGDSDEKMIEWISGYNKRKVEYDKEYEVRKVLK